MIGTPLQVTQRFGSRTKVSGGMKGQDLVELLGGKANIQPCGCKVKETPHKPPVIGRVCIKSKDVMMKMTYAI